MDFAVHFTYALLMLLSVMTCTEGNACAKVPKHRLFGPVINICERNTTTVDGFMYFSGSSAEMGSMSRCNCSIEAVTQQARLSTVVSAVSLPQFSSCNATLRILGSREKTVTCRPLLNFYLEMNTSVVTVEVDRHVVDDFDFCFYMTAKDFSRGVNYSVTCENYGGESSSSVMPPPESAPSLTTAPLTHTDSLTTAPLTPTTSLTTAPLTPTASLTTAPLTPTTSLTTAPLTPTASLTTAPLTPTASLTTAPLTHTGSLTTAPLTPTTSLTTAPLTPTASLTTAPLASTASSKMLSLTSTSSMATTLTLTSRSPVATPERKTAMTSQDQGWEDAPPSWPGTGGGGACPCDCGLSPVSGRESGDFPFAVVMLAVLGWVIAIDVTFALVLLGVRRRRRRRARCSDKGADNSACTPLSELTGANSGAYPC